MVSVHVLRAGRVVGHGDRLQIHSVGTGAVVRRTTSPLWTVVSMETFSGTQRGSLTDSARVVVRVTTGPDSHPDHHGRLGILVCLCGLRGDDADGLAVDLPDDLLAGPLNRVGVEAIVVARVRVEGSPAEALGIALAKVVGLHLRVVTAQPLPVDLVQIVGLEDGAADDALAGSRLDLEVDAPKHYVPVGLEQGRVALLGHGEGSAIAAVRRVPDGFEVSRRALGEVKGARPAERWVRGTGWREVISTECQNDQQ